jgi:hypothetical protein
MFSKRVSIMQEDKVTLKVEALLSTSPKSARDFLRALKGDGSMSDDGKKKAVNSALYKLLKEGKAVKTDSTPPLWTKPAEEKSASSSDEELGEKKVTAIFIDITNSPCHKEAIKYASQTTPIYLIANEAVEGILPKSCHFISVAFARDGESTSTQLVVTATAFACAMKAVKRASKIVIVSTAGAMNGIDLMLKLVAAPLEVEIVKDGWETLKLLLE